MFGSEEGLSLAVSPGVKCPSLSCSIIPGGATITTLLCSLTDERTTSRIRPISTGSSRIPSTLSITASASTNKPPSSVRLGGYPFPKRPRPDLRNEEEIKDDEVLNEHVGAAIVEQVPEHILSAEDHDPQTKCQVKCGTNEMCHIADSGHTECRCRPGFGKPTNLAGSKCESKLIWLGFVVQIMRNQLCRIHDVPDRGPHHVRESGDQDCQVQSQGCPEGSRELL